MTSAPNPTFRDFASQIFAGDHTGAAATLVTLLALTPERATLATEHFRGQMAEPAFLQRAMSLRTAITGASDEPVVALLGECFGLSPAEAVSGTAALRARYSVGAPAAKE